MGLMRLHISHTRRAIRRSIRVVEAGVTKLAVAVAVIVGVIVIIGRIAHGVAAKSSTARARLARAGGVVVVLDTVLSNHLVVELLETAGDLVLAVDLRLLQVGQLLAAGAVLWGPQPRLALSDARKPPLAPLDLGLLGCTLRGEAAEDALARELHRLSAVEATRGLHDKPLPDRLVPTRGRIVACAACILANRLLGRRARACWQPVRLADAMRLKRLQNRRRHPLDGGVARDRARAAAILHVACREGAGALRRVHVDDRLLDGAFVRKAADEDLERGGGGEEEEEEWVESR